jgi:hypothetical protein
MGLRPREAGVALGLVGGLHVRTATLVAVEAGPVVVVAHDDREALGREALEHLVGPRGIPDQVAQRVPGIDPGILDVGERRLEGREVGVNVGEDRDAHDHSVERRAA